MWRNSAPSRSTSGASSYTPSAWSAWPSPELSESIYLSIYLLIYLHFYLSIYLSIYIYIVYRYMYYVYRIKSMYNRCSWIDGVCWCSRGQRGSCTPPSSPCPTSSLPITTKQTRYIHSFTHPFVHSFINEFILSFINSSIHSFILSFVHSFVHSFIHIFTIQFIHT